METSLIIMMFWIYDHASNAFFILVIMSSTSETFCSGAEVFNDSNAYKYLPSP